MVDILNEVNCNEYLNLLNARGSFDSLVNEPTFSKDKDTYSSCLDHVWIRGIGCKKLKVNYTYEVIRIDFSSHRPVCVSLDLSYQDRVNA